MLKLQIIVKLIKYIKILIGALHIFRNLKRKKSKDYGNISATIIKDCDEVLSEMLSSTFNDCLSSGYYPIELIFNKGDKTHPSKCRTISLLSTRFAILGTD